MGNWVMKMVHNNYTLNLPPETQEYYIRDASGNIMSTYKRANASAGTSYNMKVTANDQPMYGSDRLGSHISGYLKNNTNTSTIYNSSIYGYYILLPTISLPTANSLKSDRLVSYRMMDYKRYEIKDHLGNVRTTFGDYRLSTVSGTGTGPYTKTNFEADQKSMYNLYAFGMPRYGNDQYYEANDIPLSLTSAYTYRFGFNGQQKDDDIKGAGNSLDFGARIYDSRLGRWLSVDPFATKYPSLSTYHFGANNPVVFIDPDGKEFDFSKMSKTEKQTYDATIKRLNKSSLFRIYYKQLEKSNVVYTISYDSKLNGGGRYNDQEHSIKLNSDNSYITSQELFHAYQDDGKFYKDRTASHAVIETEGDFASSYVAREAGVPAPSTPEWAKDMEKKYGEGIDPPTNEQVQSKEYDQEFSKSVDKRIKFYDKKGKSEKTDRYKGYATPNNGDSPKAIKALFKKQANEKTK